MGREAGRQRPGTHRKEAHRSLHARCRDVRPCSQQVPLTSPLCLPPGEGYLEISIDVGSSVIAGRVLDLCKGFAKSLVIDMAYTIEAKKEEELPERLIGACRLHFIDLDKMQHMSGSSAKGKCGGGEEPESSTGESVTVEQAAPVETVPSSRCLWPNQHIPEGQVSKVGASDGVKVAVPDVVDAVPSTVDAPPGGSAVGDAR